MSQPAVRIVVTRNDRPDQPIHVAEVTRPNVALAVVYAIHRCATHAERQRGEGP